MATTSKSKNSNINLSKNELNRIENALQDKEFVKLLGDYANELNDPENKKKYEEEIAKLEEERGMSVVFINPKPGYVLKTKNLATGNKVFINICSDDNIAKPTSKVERVAGSQGLQWSIPYSQSQPREDVDKGGDKCMVYDVIFHHDALYLAGKDLRLRGLVHNTALDALENAYKVQCDRNNLRFPKMKFKGVFRPTVIRKPLEEADVKENTLPASHQPTMEEILPEISRLKVNTPEYSVKYRQHTDLQDCAIRQQAEVGSVRPKEMVVSIKLPLLESAAGVDLDVQEKTLSLVREEPPKYNLSIDLTYPVDEERGSAKFDKSQKTLVVSLPIKPAPQLKAERLSSNDSGIEEDRDTGYRTRSCDEVIMELDDASDKKVSEISDKIDESEAYRTEEVNKVKDDFLEENVSYSLPNYTCSVQNNVIILTIEVKNVSPDSFAKKLYSDPMAAVFKFSSVGSGYVPIHYAFALGFLSAGSLSEAEFEIEFWDNNVVVNFPFVKSMESGYKVGPSLESLHETILKLGSLETETLEECNTQKPNKKKKSKYQTEKHPKAIKPTDEPIKPCNSQPKEEDVSSKKIRYSSGESIDSNMSESPMETIQLYQDTDFGDDDDMKTEESCDEELQLVHQLPPRYKRAISEDLDNKPKRGILKKQAFSYHGAGGRFRCYSESNMEDIGLAASEEKLSFALSEATIAEDEAYSFSNSQKKSVSFNEKVQQQYYRINSSIIANTAKNKKKAEKKKRALERRVSEGDAAGSFEVLNKLPASSSMDLSMMNEEWEDDSHEDSGMASSFEENLIVTSEKSNQVNNNNSVNIKPKSKRMTKRRSKQIQMANELIFDLDI